LVFIFATPWQHLGCIVLIARLGQRQRKTKKPPNIGRQGHQIFVAAANPFKRLFINWRGLNIREMVWIDVQPRLVGRRAESFASKSVEPRGQIAWGVRGVGFGIDAMTLKLRFHRIETVWLSNWKIRVPMKPSAALQANRTAIRAVVERYRACNARVFGSVVHGDDQEGSDLDILIDPTPETTLMDVARIQVELEKLLGVSVDVLTPKALPDKFRGLVLAEAIPV
jgi:predicted nucleotidyltransferase